ncbi:MAG: hypothetical protein ACHP7P_14910, partial [Terriglobales bacterium]
MASRTQDLLGRLIDTALEQADDDPMFDNRGRTGLIVPADADISDDTEEDDAFTALREDLSPGEASEEVETMRPLSAAERKILDETPGLSKLTRVDDAEQEDYVIAHSRQGYKGMDDVLDDAVYGKIDKTLAQIAYDSDMGWGIPGLSSLKKIGRMAYGTATMPLGIARRAAGTAFRAARMVPGAGTAFGIIR